MILHDHGSGGKRKAWLARGKTETPAFLQSGVEPFAVSADRASGKKWDKRTVPAYKTNGSSSQRWKTGDGFTLQGMAACGGCVTFGNDGNEFYVVK